ncbi:MAG: 16S rRNA (cytosine(1402)-N(4))-methyltransferase RsmH [Elusimicrobia bacterium]|nr:16S rRNA (cytosine(1402)-N(4))-methyltransferase RsmH [Elusimicrobiota bacterium]
MNGRNAPALCAAQGHNLMDENYLHQPVLAEETAQLLVTDKAGVYVDATLGLGGHAIKLLSTLDEKGKVLGVDWDPEMAGLAARNLEPYGGRAKVVQGNFANLDQLIAAEHLNTIAGVLFDLGISSLHFDKPSRGFSLKYDGPLDMRINPLNPLTAYNIVNHWPYEQLEHLIRICGERYAGRIAREIMDKRQAKPVETTAELRTIIEKATPYHGEKTHPATRTFLALRVAVNYELDNLTRGIQKVMPFLAKGARMGVITFHSLEDRIVKETFRFMVKMGNWKLVTKKPVAPSEAELKANKRARSAKLRVIEKVQEAK